jgi:ABC-type sugar transport system, periplasmic component
MKKILSLVLSLALLLGLMAPAAIAEARPKLTVGVMQTPFIADYETNYFTKYIEDLVGVDLEFVLYPSDPPGEKVLLTLSTNDVQSLPDIFLSIMMSSNNTIFGPSYASAWYDSGMIIPLNDLIEKYGENTKKAIDLANEYGYNIRSWIGSPDGNIYSLPSFSASLTNSYPHKLWINQGWLDKLELEMPTTTEEFRTVLRAFKEKDPNGNGINDEIPFSGAKQLMYYGYDFLINAFIYNHSSMSRMYVEEGTVKFAPTTNEWREAMKYLRELNDEGLFYAGTFTQDTTTIQQMATNENDILGVFEGLGHDVVVVTDNQDIIDRYNSMPALIGPEGNHFVTWNAPSTRPSGVITANCKDPELAMKVLDAMMSWDAAVITRYGEKGVNWDMADEGTLGYYGIPAIMKILENTWAAAGQNQNFLQQSPFILDPAIATGIQWGGNEKEAGYIKAMAVVKLDETGIVPDEYLANLVFTPDEIEQINAPRLDIDTYITQSIANFVAGDWDPTNDTQWNNYVAEFDRMALPTYLEVVQTAYTRMTAN